MLQQNIFDNGDTFPFVFLKQKQNVSVKKLNPTVYKSFYLKPKQVENQSMVVKLKNLIGIQVGGVKTLTTDYIRLQRITKFNGSDLILQLENDIVVLYVSISGGLFFRCHWEVSELVSMMKMKNTDKLITETLVKQLLKVGRLQVKFNVSKSKDHGTKWIFKDEKIEIKKPSILKQKVKSVPVENFDEFFIDF